MTFALEIKTSETLASEAAVAHRAKIISAIDASVENVARGLGYNSAAHCASYVASTVPEWKSEAESFVAWRDAVWVAAFASQAAAQASGETPSVEDVLAALPSWSIGD